MTYSIKSFHLLQRIDEDKKQDSMIIPHVKSVNQMVILCRQYNFSSYSKKWLAEARLGKTTYCFDWLAG